LQAITSESVHASDKSLLIPVDAITPNPHQPRRVFEDATLERLAASMKSSGVIQPILLKAVPGKPGSYELIAGERRWRAARIAGLAALPAVVRDDVDSYSQAQLALVENIQREDLNPIDRASAYRGLMTQLGLTQSELASRLGEDRSGIANYLRLLDLSGPVQTLIREGKITLGHAKVLAGVNDVLEQTRLANLAAEQQLSVRNLERMIQTKSAPAAVPSAAGKSAHLVDLEKSLARQLGMRVQVKSGAKRGKGRLIIHYADLDQFDQLLAKMGLKAE
jgi:ParB family chromosome partitioning protein